MKVQISNKFGFQTSRFQTFTACKSEIWPPQIQTLTSVHVFRDEDHHSKFGLGKLGFNALLAKLLKIKIKRLYIRQYGRLAVHSIS